MEPRSRRYVHNIPAARSLRPPQTETENMLWEALRDRRVDGLKFRRQHAVQRFVLDFYCHELRLAVEVDGAIHESPEHKVADAVRQAELEELGIQFVRISADLVRTDLAAAVRVIREQAAQ